MHRAVVLVAAVYYFVLCMRSTIATTHILRDMNNPGSVGTPDVGYLIGTYIGTKTIRESLLVTLALQGDTSPRNGTLYLEAAGPSMDICAGIMAVQHDIYTDAFLRSIYDAVVRGTTYNLTFLAAEETELIMPVVDCMSSAIFFGYLPTGKFTFLTRKTHDPDDVAIVTLQLYNQEYLIASQSERGPASVATMTYINDLRAPSVTHYFLVSLGYPYAEFDFRVHQLVNVTDEGMWCLESVPDTRSGEIPKILTTAFRSGLYMKSETEQFNIVNQVPLLSNIPRDVITQSVSATKTVMHDSWAWVHGIQFFLGVDLLLNLGVLFLVVYRNVQTGKLWIGDAFVSVSTKILLVSAAVLLSWYFNGFWALFEFCVHDANRVLGLDMLIYDDMIHVDLLCIYFSLCGVIGRLFHARVDPALAMICFTLGYELRHKIIAIFPKTKAALYAYAYRTYVDGVPLWVEGQELISPMSFWTSHLLHNKSATFVFQTLLPIFSTLIFVVAAVIGDKVYHYFFHEAARTQTSSGSSTAARSGRDGDTQLLRKRVLTLFEIATGAELESRCGIMTSYETYLFIKGMKFASADGIYSNGFVIVNDKFVIQSSDYWSIVLMKIVQRRFRTVYAYEIVGTTVQQTARLVYPRTFTFKELLSLNITVLS
uniref:Uncharacterized protein n=1 Tax=Globisporangium ultimum (strain ATCC 200006 / CBS 805.95 / DAOM BR144) TaxID=431595 RepID=K3W8J5_GLOUD